MQSYFAVSNNNRLNSTHYFITKISSKRELQQITFNHSPDIGFRNFIKMYYKAIFVLVIDTTLASDNHLRFK